MLKSIILASGLTLICAISGSAQSLPLYPKCSGRMPPEYAQSLNTYVLRHSAGSPGIYYQVVTPEMVAERLRLDQITALDRAGHEDLQAGNNALAEANYRQAVALNEADTSSYKGLGLALAAEGQKGEAIQVYRKIFYDLATRGMQSPNDPYATALRADVYRNPIAHGGSGAAASMEDGFTYALLLNETGQWAEAVTVYESALALLQEGNGPKIDIHFSQDVLQPLELEAAAHIALGLDLNCTGWEDATAMGQNRKAMKNYARALQLEPDWPLANYYYGYGWQHLSPTERVKFGTVQQAKAALQKAVKIGNASVKAAALKALKSAG